jgi:DNA polymerase-3 subunit gamma/tau
VSYQVIARKYRPQTFADLTGQEHISRTLSHALDQNRLHHAYLFSGARGTGKTTTARIVAKGLNCHTGITSRPCLKCPSCLEIAQGNSIDVLEIDAASNTGVGDVRDVIVNNIAFAPARDRFKVFVIDEVHMLSNAAFNALLKTIEEPPAHVVFVMATTELHKVPETILSRCQQFEFRQIPTEKIFQRLREISTLEKIEASDESLREVARAASGSLRDAQSALDQVIAFAGDRITGEEVAAALGLAGAKTLTRLVESIANQQTPAVLELINEIVSRGYDLRNFTRELMAHFRHLLMIKSGIDDVDTLGVAEIEIGHLREVARLFSEEDLVRLFHLLAETEKDVKDSPHPRFQLEVGLVRLAQLARLRPLDELISRLEALESKIGGRTGPPSAGGSEAQKKPEPVGSPLGNIARTQAPVTPPVQSPRQRVQDSEPDFDEPVLEEPPEFTAYESLQSREPASGQPEEIIHRIRAELERQKRGVLITALEDAQSVVVDADRLVATYRREDQLSKMLRNSDEVFRDVGQRLIGKPLIVEIRTSGDEQPVNETSLAKEKQRARALANPAVRLVVDNLQGEIIDIRSRNTSSDE